METFLIVFPTNDTHAALGDVIRVIHDVPGQPEVTDLHQLPFADEHVPRSQIAMDALCGHPQTTEERPDPAKRFTNSCEPSLSVFMSLVKLLSKNRSITLPGPCSTKQDYPVKVS